MRYLFFILITISLIMELIGFYNNNYEVIMEAKIDFWGLLVFSVVYEIKNIIKRKNYGN